MIRLEDQPVIVLVQTLVRVLILLGAVFALLGLIVGILVWRQGRRGNCEDEEEAGEVLVEEGREGGVEEGEGEQERRDCPSR